MTRPHLKSSRRIEIARRSKDLRRRAGFYSGDAGVSESNGLDGASEPEVQIDEPVCAANDESCTNSSANATFATFSRIYESLDGKLCLFEDAHGHLSAVNAKRLV